MLVLLELSPLMVKTLALLAQLEIIALLLMSLQNLAWQDISYLEELAQYALQTIIAPQDQHQPQPVLQEHILLQQVMQPVYHVQVVVHVQVEQLLQLALQDNIQVDQHALIVLLVLIVLSQQVQHSCALMDILQVRLLKHHVLPAQQGFIVLEETK